PLQAFTSLKLADSFQSSAALEFHGQLSFIKGGLVYADRIVTVSPSYAREITTPAFGAGMEGLLQYRNSHLTGILNGVDYDVWDPRHDLLIYSQYWTNRLAGKTNNKLCLQHELGLAENGKAILLGFIGRLTEQKGFDLILANLTDIMKAEDIQVVILGEGNNRDRELLLNAAATYSGRMAVNFSYSEVLAHRIQAAADILLMPSRFEPCGLSQLYALRYGTIPVTSLTGGLIDTIVDTNAFSLQNRTATGFHFSLETPGDFPATVLRAINLCRNDKGTWRRLMRTAMKQEFSWDNSAKQYSSHYQDILAARTASLKNPVV
ncbi:MAG: glycogen/starch synthase, partial [Gammaproteobacteria bacterium]